MAELTESRPYPPINFTGENWLPYTLLIPATEIGEWVSQHILSEAGRIHNPDHTHLLDADVAFMWASGSSAKSGRIVLGQCEQVMMRASGWQKARMEQQMHEWFGRIPKFIKETGMPVLKLRGHDVEEFVGVVRRYGASKDVQEMVDAANRPAEVAHIDVARACGTCMLKLA